MLGAVGLKEKSVPLDNLLEGFLEVQEVRVWWQVRQLLSQLVSEELLVVEERGDVDESEETESAGLEVKLEGDFSVALLRVDDVDEHAQRLLLILCHV